VFSVGPRMFLSGVILRDFARHAAGHPLCASSSMVCDRFEPGKPWWALLTAAFIFGERFLANLGGGGISSGVGESPAPFRDQPNWRGSGDPAIQAFGATVLAPIFEEGFKGSGVALVAGISELGS